MNNVIKIVVGVVVGGCLGYGYHRLVGCSSGACPLVGNPWIATLYGMFMGGMLAGMR